MARSSSQANLMCNLLLSGAATASLMAQSANAQVVAPPQVPLSDMQCNYPVGAPPNSQFGLPAASTCSTTGTRNIGAPTVTQTSVNASTTRVTGEWVVNYSGALAIDGLPVSLVQGQQFTFDATNFYDPAAISVNVTDNYTGVLLVVVFMARGF